MTRSSQTMRIDISPKLKGELKAPEKTQGLTPRPEPAPQMPDKSPSIHALGNVDFQELFQSVYDGAIIANLDGTIVDANPRALSFLRYTQAELTVLNLTHIVSGATPETIATLKTGVSNDRFVLMQAYCARKDQSIFPSEIAASPLQAVLRSTPHFGFAPRLGSTPRRASRLPGAGRSCRAPPPRKTDASPPRRRSSFRSRRR